MRWQGSVVVRFEGGFGAGETVWSPAAHGQFTVAENETRNGRRMAAFLASTEAASVHARVESATGVCTDVGGEAFDQAAVSRAKDGIRIGLAGSSPQAGGFHMTETRCGGPLLDDIGRALGTVHVPRAQLLAGSFDIDFRGAAPLAVPGMRASVESTVVAHIGARVQPPKQPPQRATPGGTNLLRVGYRVERVSGGVHADFTGGGELCAELDSCGRRAVLRLRPGRPLGARVDLTAYAPGRRPLNDLRAALGLPNDGGRADGIDWSGYGRLQSRSNTLTSSVVRDDVRVCEDRRHIPAVALSLEPAGRAVNVDLRQDVLASTRTACPGPALAATGFAQVLASGSIPRRAFARKRITLRLTGGRGFTSDGWSGRTRASFTIVLRRTSVGVRHFKF